jgi:hypothetical protein
MGPSQLQLTDTIYDVRSFTNRADYYYVNQELLATQGTNPFSYLFTQNQVPDSTLILPPSILQPSPQSNPSATTYTSGVTFSIGGSAGVNAAQGLNASLNFNLSISNSTTVTVPPIQILNLANPIAGVPAWEYHFDTAPQTGVTTALNDQWIWQVPFTSYPYSPNTIPFAFTSEALYAPQSDITDQKGANWSYTAPRPFGNTFALVYPQVGSVSQQTVNPGQVFTIEGSGLYPAMVQGVLIGGQALSNANFTPINDHEIQIVAPNTPGNALLVVVLTSQGPSLDNVSINITGPSLVHVQAQYVTAQTGQALFEQSVASFTYPDPTAPPTNFTATIDWGDGFTSFGRITGDQGSYSVLGSHTYREAGTYPFSVLVTDVGGDKSTAGAIANVTGTVGPQPLVGHTVAAVAGQEFTNTAVATLTDSNPNARPTDFSATIDWGDGTISAGTVTDAGQGTFNVLGSHTYARAGRYEFGVRVISGANQYSTTWYAIVSAGGPKNLVAQRVAAAAGQPFTDVKLARIADSDSGASAKDFTATIDWGDGISTPNATVIADAGHFTVLGSHRYDTHGNHTFKIQVTDRKDRKVSTTGTAAVSIS